MKNVGFQRVGSSLAMDADLANPPDTAADADPPAVTAGNGLVASPSVTQFVRQHGWSRPNPFVRSFNCLRAAAPSPTSSVCSAVAWTSLIMFFRDGIFHGAGQLDGRALAVAATDVGKVTGPIIGGVSALAGVRGCQLFALRQGVQDESWKMQLIMVFGGVLGLLPLLSSYAIAARKAAASGENFDIELGIMNSLILGRILSHITRATGGSASRAAPSAASRYSTPVARR